MVLSNVCSLFDKQDFILLLFERRKADLPLGKLSSTEEVQNLHGIVPLAGTTSLLEGGF
jgi:hypothetical protein